MVELTQRSTPTSPAAGPRVHVVDNLGLADHLAARIEHPDDLVIDRMGHIESRRAWRVARFAKPSPQDVPDDRLAREALRCGELAELHRAVTAPMTPGRFVRNVTLAPRTRTTTFARWHWRTTELMPAAPLPETGETFDLIRRLPYPTNTVSAARQHLPDGSARGPQVKRIRMWVEGDEVQTLVTQANGTVRLRGVYPVERVV